MKKRQRHNLGVVRRWADDVFMASRPDDADDVVRLNQVVERVEGLEESARMLALAVQELANIIDPARER